MKFLFLGVFFFISLQAWALKLEFLSQTVLGHKAKFEKTVIGGLSGITYDADSQTLMAVSDDRGREGEPRFYEFSVRLEKLDLKIEPTAVRFLKKKEQKRYDSILDMEGVARLPWGSFLISSEGDLNHKPKVLPELWDVKKDGTLVRTYEIPSKFLPEESGKPKRGTKVNRALEGLTATPSGRKFFLMNEESLIQDSENDLGPLRLLEYEMPEAWVLKPTKEYVYLPEKGSSKDGSLTLAGRVSEILALSDEKILVLERTMSLSAHNKNFQFVCRLYLSQIEKTSSDVGAVNELTAAKLASLVPLKKELVLDFEAIKDKLGGEIENFEGMALGPIVNGKKTLIVVADDNFKKSQRTQFVLFAIQE